MTKFARRHRELVGGAAAAVLALVIGFGAAVHYALRARADAALAVEREADAMRESYRATIAAATAALRERDVVDAEAHLEHSSIALRGWEWEHLKSQLDESMACVPIPASTDSSGRSGSSVAFSADGRFIHATERIRGDETRTFWTWDAADLTSRGTGTSGGAVGFWTSRQTRVVRYTDDGERVMMLHDDGRMVIASAASGAVGYDFAVCDDIAGDRAFPDDVAQLAKAACLFVDGFDASRRVAWVRSPDGQYAAGAAQSTVAVWSLIAGKRVDLPHVEGAADLAFSPDGKRLVTAGLDRALRMFDVQRVPEAEWVAVQAHDDAILCVAFSRDGSLVASGSEDRTIRLQQSETGREIGVLLGHRNPVRSVAFSPDGRTLVSSDGQFVRLWDVGDATRGVDPTVLGWHDTTPRAIAISPDGSLIATAGRKVRLWDARSRSLITVLQPDQKSEVRRMYFSADGSLLLVHRPNDHNPMSALEVQTGEPVQATGAITPLLREAGSSVVEIRGALHAMMKPMQSGVVVYREGKVVREWLDVRGRSLAISPDGNMLAVGGDFIQLLDIETGKLIGELRGHADSIHALAFHPDGKRLASGANDRTIRLWDLDTLTEIAQLRGHLDRVFALEFSPDGSTLYSASGDRTIRVWGTQPAREPHHRAAHVPGTDRSTKP